MDSGRRSTPVRPLVAAALALALAPAAARADDTTRVTVLPYAPLFGKAPQSMGDKTTELVEAELKQNPAFEVVSPSDAGKKGEAKKAVFDVAAATKNVETAVADFEKAAGLVKKRKVKPATEAYEKAIDLYLKNLAGASDLKPVSDALVQLAIAYFKLDAQDKGTATLERLVRTDPDRILEAPEVVNLLATLHQKARKQILGGARGTLKVESNPAGAEVFVDTRKVGETPLIVSELVPGDHYLKVVKDGVGTTFDKVTVNADDSVALSAALAGEASGALAGISRAIQSNKLDEASIDALVQVGKASKADYVIFGALVQGDEAIEVKTYAFAPKDKGTLELTAVQFDPELLGAQIEVYKLVSEFAEKVQDFTGTAPVLPLAIVGGADGAVEASEPRVVAFTRDRGEGKPMVAEEDEGEGRRRRGPVKKKTDEPEAVVETKKEETKAAEVVAEEEPKKKTVRKRGKIGETEPDEEKAAPAKKVDEDEGGLKLGTSNTSSPASSPSKADALAAALREEEDRRAAEKAKAASVNITAVPTTSGPTSSSLSPEELAKLDAASKARAESRTDWGSIALWGGIGAVVVGGLVTGAVLVASPGTPSAARPVVSWTP